MLIGGLQKSSLIDFKGKIAAIVFLQGCNFSCPYCHNPELVIPMLAHPILEKEVFDFLKKRVGKLDGVVISGGEPTIHKDLPLLVKKIRDMGFQIKLDTNGTNPAMLEDMMSKNLLDYIAMDIKTNFEDYIRLVRRQVNVDDVIASARMIANSSIDYEFRTTVVEGLLNFDNFVKINENFKNLLLSRGKIKRYYLQKFQKSKHLDETFVNSKTFSDEEFEKVAELFRESVLDVMVR